VNFLSRLKAFKEKAKISNLETQSSKRKEQVVLRNLKIKNVIYSTIKYQQKSDVIT